MAASFYILLVWENMLGKNQIGSKRKTPTDYICNTILKLCFAVLIMFYFMTITVMRVCLSTSEAAVYTHVHSALFQLRVHDGLFTVQILTLLGAETLAYERTKSVSEAAMPVGCN